LPIWPIESGVSTLSVSSYSRRPHLVVALTGLIALAAGDAAMVAVTAVAHRAVPGLATQWGVAATLIGLGSYALCGAPQLRAWRREDVALDDARARFAVRTLRRGGLVAFAIASVAAGPLAVAWFYGRSAHPLARPLTRVSAGLFGAVWSALYLGVVGAIF
jgi:hypothetical protein